MSIDETKKKSKLSMDEMVDSKDVGKTVKQDAVHKVGRSESMSLKTNYINENSTEKTATATTVKYPCKMTFYMTQEVYDAFNYIYARRLIEKKKIDKGALFCEAVQLLVENEEKYRKF